MADIAMSCRPAGANGIAPPRAGTRSGAVARGAADLLCLAAAPSFAIMAVLAGAFGGADPNLICSHARGASALGGMVPMYVLMGAFHSTPWLKLISRRRSRRL